MTVFRKKWERLRESAKPPPPGKEKENRGRRAARIVSKRKEKTVKRGVAGGVYTYA